jgi:hypothetical protein
MAKTQAAVKQAKAAAAKKALAAAVCQLRSIPNSIDLSAGTGETIELFTHDHVGMVLIAKAEYGGQQLVPPRQAVPRIEFDALAGRNTLKIVFVFSASVSGRGELREDCGEGESQFLRVLAGSEPLQILRIIGS